MARSGAVERLRGANCCSYKRATAAVCGFNLVAAVFVLSSIYAPSFLSPDLKSSDDQIRRVEESVRIRKESVPVELVKLVKELRKEFTGQARPWEPPPRIRRMLTDEILEVLRGAKNATNVTEQQEAVQLWRVEKLKAVKKMALPNAAPNPSISVEEAKMLGTALESDWLTLLGDIGLWMPADVINSEINDVPDNAEEDGDEDIIPGLPLPPECHAEPHTDYAGDAVRWGLTHHKDSAADCCQACLDQAKLAKPGEMKCNIWVYCPSDSGCYSPDIYEHNNRECWLKQASTPRLNFKKSYSESYRASHPNAPVVVPWMSGIVSS